MMITTAILEFFVIGALWVALTVSTVLITLPGRGPEFFTAGAMKEIGWLWTLISVPTVYLIGVITQGVSWYLYKPIHIRLLHNRITDKRGDSYVKLYRMMKGCGYKSLELLGDLEETPGNIGEGQFRDHSHLEAFLDVLRWELFHCERTELARQYLIQFHLWRICFGSIPPFFFFALLNVFAALWCRVSGCVVWPPLVFCALLVALGMLASFAAAHRDTRTWKYLRYGMAAILGAEQASQK